MTRQSRFQSTLPHGERPWWRQDSNLRSHFNPRSRMGSDRGGGRTRTCEAISIHAPAWGATRSLVRTVSFAIIISIHAPAWGATRFSNRAVIAQRISIHAPAWGATNGGHQQPKHDLFQSTLPHGERPCRHFAVKFRDIFQSTLPHGERLLRFATAPPYECISIHAPAWGATPGEYRDCKSWDVFQSTLPHGERPHTVMNVPSCADFNPRSRMGSDAIAANRLRNSKISIHAPAWGATRTTVGTIPPQDISIHAPAWGATNPTDEAKTLMDISIHAPAWGATGLLRRGCHACAISIHAPAWGATRSIRRWTAVTRYFNPRSRMGSDANANLIYPGQVLFQSTLCLFNGIVAG